MSNEVGTPECPTSFFVRPVQREWCSVAASNWFGEVTRNGRNTAPCALCTWSTEPVVPFCSSSVPVTRTRRWGDLGLNLLLGSLRATLPRLPRRSAEGRQSARYRPTASPFLDAVARSSRRSSSSHTSTPMRQLARSGVNVSRPMLVAGTCSSHTVCQMPVVRGYQMEWISGFQSCFPRGLARSRGSSSARTMISQVSPTTRSVMSRLNGVYRPHGIPRMNR